MTARQIYFIRPVGMLGPIKIGCSDNPEVRIKPLAQWSPFPLEIVATAPGGYKDELYIHRCFSKSHSHHEWFVATPRLLTLIEQVKASGSIAAAFDLKPEGVAPSMAGRTPWPECRRRYMSYVMRVGNLARRTKKQPPSNISSILRNWYETPGFVDPAEEQIALLDRYLSAPVETGAAA